MEQSFSSRDLNLLSDTEYCSEGEHSADPQTARKSAHFLLWDQGLGCLSKHLSRNRIRSKSSSTSPSYHKEQSPVPAGEHSPSTSAASCRLAPALSPLAHGSLLQHQLLRFPPALMGAPQTVGSSFVGMNPVGPFAVYSSPAPPSPVAVPRAFLFGPNTISVSSPRTLRESWTPSANSQSPISSHTATPRGRDHNVQTPVSMNSNSPIHTSMSPIESAIVLSATPIPAAKVLHDGSSSSPVSARWAVVPSPLQHPLPPSLHSGSQALALPATAMPEGAPSSQLHLSIQSSSSALAPPTDPKGPQPEQPAPQSPSGSSDGRESENGDDSPGTPRSRGGKAQYFCDYPGCTRKEPLSNRYTLKRHIRIMHSANPRPKNFQCDFAGCTSRFADKDKLMRHMLCHDQSPNNKFYCSHCNRPFTDKSNRNRHQDRCSARRAKAHNK